MTTILVLITAATACVAICVGLLAIRVQSIANQLDRLCKKFEATLGEMPSSKSDDVDAWGNET